MKKLIVITAMISGLALAHAGAEGVIKDRMDAMSAIGDANKALSNIARGRADFDIDIVKASAQTIAMNSGSGLVELFPVDSLDNTTEALPAIWEDWDTFENIALELESAALELAQISSEDEFTDLYKGVSGTCRSCHSDFRE